MDFLAEAQELTEGLQALGLAPVSVVGHSISRRHENWRVELEDGTRRLLRIPHRGDRSLQREEAALSRLAGSDLPVVRSYRRVDEAFGGPAVLSSWLDGADGLGVMDAHPELLPVLCQLMGSVRLQLEQQTVGPFAGAVAGGRFYASRSYWAGEYRARVHDWAARASRAGLSLGPSGVFALQIIAKASAVLAKVPQGCLVHGDLRPVNFLLDLERSSEKNQPSTVSLLGIVDWEFACVGDPLLAWALPLELPDDALAHVVEGYGRERVAAWLQNPEMLIRLNVYSLGRVFQYLAEVVRYQVDRDQHWGHGLTHAARMLEERLQPDFAKSKLSRVLGLEELPEKIVPAVWEVPQRAVCWHALCRLGYLPGVPRDRIGSWLAAVACGLRHETHPDEGWAREGESYLEQLPIDEPVEFEPLPDRAAWLTGLERHVTARRTDLAVVVLWLGYRSLAFLGNGSPPERWMVSNAVLRGLQGLVELAGSEPEPTDPKGVLRMSAMAFAAENELANLLERPISEQKQAARLQRIREAWEDLTLFQGHEPSEEVDSTTWGVPVMLLAVDGLRDLPMTPGELINAVTT